jgi:hypothetical protein
MKKQSEQPSEVKAEESLPETLNHMEMCDRLVSIPSDDKSIPNIRCFYSPDGSVFLGILLGETDDSFLVGAAAKMMMNKDRQITSEPISAEPVIRVIKNSLKYIVTAQELTQYHYYAFLEGFGYKYLPDYFTEARKEHISLVRSNPRFVSTISEEDLEDDTVGNERPEIPGASQFAFISPLVSERIH